MNDILYEIWIKCQTNWFNECKLSFFLMNGIGIVQFNDILDLL